MIAEEGRGVHAVGKRRLGHRHRLARVSGRDPQGDPRAVSVNVVDFSATLALESARLSVDSGLSISDAIILATARTADAVLWTQDSHFEGLDSAEFRDTREAGLTGASIGASPSRTALSNAESRRFARSQDPIRSAIWRPGRESIRRKTPANAPPTLTGAFQASSADRRVCQGGPRAGLLSARPIC